MSRFVLPFCLLASLGLAPGADLASVRKVYFLPMSNGLDQYLANRVTSESLFDVVTDPKLADAVFTDQIGMGFEHRMEALLPPEEPPAAEGKDEKAEKSEKGDSGAEERTGKIGEGYTARFSTFSRGKGNVFLVDLKSRHVVWSVFQRPKQGSPEELDKTSTAIVSQLKKARSPQR